MSIIKENMQKVLLLVEDDPLMLRMYEKIFKFEGYQVDTAKDGEEGLEKAKTQKPVVILLDIMMPKMNGIEMLEKLKKDADTKSIPVVVLTNLAGAEDAEKVMSLGAVRYIVKSEHEPKEIVAIVKEILVSNTNDVTQEPSNRKE